MSRIIYNLSGSPLSRNFLKTARSLECYFAVLFIYFEVMFHMLITGKYGENLFLKMAFGVFFGFVIGTAVSAIGKLAGKITGLAITVLITVFYCAHIVYYGVFATHLSVTGSIGFTNQAMDFTDVILKEIKHDWWKLLLFIIPVLVYIFVIWKHSEFKRHRALGYVVNLGSAAVFYIAIIFVLRISSNDIYSPYKLIQNYQSVDMSVRKLGVVETLFVEFTHHNKNGEVSFENELTSLSSGNGQDVETVISTEDKTEKATTEIVENDNKNSSTEAVTTEAPVKEKVVDRSPNVLDIDFDKLIAEEKDENIKAIHNYVKNVTPTNKNEYTGMFEGYNLIFVVAEGFDGYLIDQQRTPTLYQMAHSGFYFKNFYTPLWYGSTIGGEFANLTGLMPNNGGYLSMNKCGENGNDMLFTPAQQLLKKGYAVRGYHDNDYTYYDRNISHPNMGYTWKGVGNGLEAEKYEDGTELWPQSDVKLINDTFDEYSGREPFHTYYLTVSGHVMYNFGGNAMADKHRDIVENLQYSDETKAYIACQYELELAMKTLVQKLENEGIADNTLIVLVADHVPYDNKNVVDELAGSTLGDTFEWYKNTLIIWSASMKEQVVVNKYCSSLDILPTVSNLMGLPYDSRMIVGQDILSDSPALVMFNDRSFITDSVMYDANTGEVMKITVAEVSDDYVESIKQVVSNKFNLAQSIVDYNYYAVIDQAVYGNSVNELDDSDNMPLKKKDKSAEDDSKVSNYKDAGDESAKSADKTDNDKSAKSTDKTGSDESAKSDDNTGSDGSTNSVDKDSENESANSADNKNSDAVIKSSYKDIDEIYKKLNGTTNNDKKDNNNFGKMLNSNKEEDWFKKLTKTDDDVNNSLEKIFEKRKNGGN